MITLEVCECDRDGRLAVEVLVALAPMEGCKAETAYRMADQLVQELRHEPFTVRLAVVATMLAELEGLPENAGKANLLNVIRRMNVLCRNIPPVPLAIKVVPHEEHEVAVKAGNTTDAVVL